MSVAGLSTPAVVFIYIALGAFGLLFGSFANVLIWRIPRGESIVSPGSHCPRCEHPIRWYDNIPVVSWLMLGGKCRDCGETIAWRYPIIELASGALWMLAGWRYGLTPQLPLAIVFFYTLLVLAVVDIDTRRLPTPLVSVIAIAAVIAVGASLATGLPFGPLTGLGAHGWLGNPAVVAVAGFLLGAGTSIAVASAYAALRRIEGLGFGDVRLLGAMGLVLGPFVLLAYALANIIGVFGAIPVMMRSRRLQREQGDEQASGPERADFWDETPAGEPIQPAEGAGTVSETDPAAATVELAVEPAGAPPLSIQFGPFLALAGVVTAMWGPALWQAYLRLLGMA